LDWKKKFLELTPKPTFSTKIVGNSGPPIVFTRSPVQQPAIEDNTANANPKELARAYHKQNKKLHSVLKVKGADKRAGQRRKCLEMAEFEGLL
jgi:hypothetical protein